MRPIKCCSVTVVFIAALLAGTGTGQIPDSRKIATTSATPMKVACVGNSITEGWSGNPSYVPALQKLLGSEYTVLKLGKSGATALKNGDVPYWNQGVYTQALKADADIITIELGTNDAKSKNWSTHSGEFKGDYAALIDALQSANKNAVVFPVIPVPVCKENYGIQSSILKTEIPIIKQIANEKGLTVIDANTPLLSHCSYFTDGIHPNQSGADSIASVISRTIQGVTNSVKVAIAAPVSRTLNYVYMVVNGNVSSAFNRMTPGDRYELSVFNLNGALLCKLIVDGSPYSQSQIRNILAQDNSLSMKLLHFKKQLNRGV